jgi:hypothetical protein
MLGPWPLAGCGGLHYTSVCSCHMHRSKETSGASRGCNAYTPTPERRRFIKVCDGRTWASLRSGRPACCATRCLARRELTGTTTARARAGAAQAQAQEADAAALGQLRWWLMSPSPWRKLLQPFPPAVYPCPPPRLVWSSPSTVLTPSGQKLQLFGLTDRASRPSGPASRFTQDLCLVPPLKKKVSLSSTVLVYSTRPVVRYVAVHVFAQVIRPTGVFVQRGIWNL